MKIRAAAGLLSAALLASFAAVAQPRLQGIAQISTNGFSTCAVTSFGGVKCWGQGYGGQLGNGAEDDSVVPVDVTGLASGVTSVASVAGRICALLADGTVRCWGINTQGEAGDGTTVNHSTPVPVKGLTERALALAVAYDRSCAITQSGKLFCWGSNANGQLGMGVSSFGPAFAEITTIGEPVRQVSLGENHSCVLTRAGGVKCWGSNPFGEAGDPARASIGLPTGVAGLSSGVTAIAAGSFFTCAAMDTGRVKCWGRNQRGLLGDGSGVPSRPSPAEVPGLGDVVALSTQYTSICALTRAGQAHCWGANEKGQLGDGTFHDRSTPSTVLVDGAIASLSSGYMTSCAVLVGGQVRCWGSYYSGALGDGRIASPSNRPMPVPAMPSVAQVSLGYFYFCALTADGAVRCAGQNNDGEIGPDAEILQITPVTVTTGIAALSNGASHQCAVQRDGGVSCWGFNYYGQLGDGVESWSRSTPAPVVGLAGPVVSVTVQSFYTCAIIQGGRVQCWGSNQLGVLALDPGVSISRRPVDIPGLASGATAIGAGDYHVCAVVAGAVMCWGDIGPVPGTSPASPAGTVVNIPGLESGMVSVAAGTNFTCALTASGTVKCWGDNRAGQLGDGTTTDRWVPAEVAGLSGVRSIAATGFRACAVLSTGALACWGDNTNGEIGDATFTSRSRPVTVIDGGVASVAMAGSHTCALQESGGLLCWGDSYDGYFTGVRPASAAPVPVLAGAGIATPANWQDMWWVGPQENGWGMSIAQHGDTLFGAIFAYDSAGDARWYVMPGGSWNADKTVFTGDLYSPSGAPYSAYDTARFVAGRPAGGVRLTFDSATSLVMDGAFDDMAFRRTLTRQVFAVGTAMNNLSDLWWGGPAQNGWGIALTQQGDTTFAVWYTYDASGRPTWFVLPGGSWNAGRTQYSGTLYSTTNRQGWLVLPYNASTLQVNTAGNIVFDFTTPSDATMTYSVGGITQAKTIVRQPF